MRGQPWDFTCSDGFAHDGSFSKGVGYTPHHYSENAVQVKTAKLAYKFRTEPWYSAVVQCSTLNGGSPEYREAIQQSKAQYEYSTIHSPSDTVAHGENMRHYNEVRLLHLRGHW